MKAPSQRQLRAGEIVRHALTEILAREEFDDPDLQGRSITITEVRVSPDLKHASAFCAPLGGTDAAKVVAALNRASRFLRGRLAQAVELKFSPTVKFLEDASFEYAARMDALFAAERAERRRRATEGDGEEDA